MTVTLTPLFGGQRHRWLHFQLGISSCTICNDASLPLDSNGCRSIGNANSDSGYEPASSNWADLPGFYYDAEKNRYFPIKGPIPGSARSSCSSSSTALKATK
ncbi:hypothetical protein TIFTF001_043939, partial [Ficus carica]